MTRARWSVLWPWLAALSPWFILLNFLRLEWSANAQYAYGFVVPPLALYLAALRWPTRPEPEPLRACGWLLGLGVFLMFLWVPLLLLAEASPEWRLIGWGLALVAEGIAFLLLLARGGWPWARHFAFPVLFIMVAVPWPTSLELKVMLPMMEQDASGAVGMLRWCGVPAMQRQNVIDLPGGSVGVDEACSGIRSLQTSLMIALFVGEWLRLGAVRRVLLLVASVGLTYGLNVLRTLLLVFLSNRYGPAALPRWHDPAGLAILVLSLAGLWGLAILLGGRERHSPGMGSRVGPAAPWPKVALLMLAAWSVLVVAGVNAWFDGHEQRAAGATSWTVRWPTRSPTYEAVEIPEAARTSFLYSTAASSAAKWQDAARLHLWLGYFLRWEAGRETSILASTHHPDVCLPAAGMPLSADFGATTFPAAGFQLPGELYQFDDGGQPLFVFYCVWSNERATSSSPEPTQPSAPSWWKKVLLPFTPQAALDYRLQAIARGQRNEGQQVLELGLWGARDRGEADQLLTSELQRLIKR